MLDFFVFSMMLRTCPNSFYRENICCVVNGSFICVKLLVVILSEKYLCVEALSKWIYGAASKGMLNDLMENCLEGDYKCWKYSEVWIAINSLSGLLFFVFFFFCLPFFSSPDKVAGSVIFFNYNLLLQIFLTYFDQVRWKSADVAHI